MRLPPRTLPRLLCAALLLSAAVPVIAAAFPPDLFGHRQAKQTDTGLFSQWMNVLERHLLLDRSEGDCTETTFNTYIH